MPLQFLRSRFNLILPLTAVLFITLVNSCSTSNNVSSNGFIQKRKYNKGWHIKSRQRIKSSSHSDNVERLNDNQINAVQNNNSTTYSSKDNPSTLQKVNTGIDQDYSQSHHFDTIHKEVETKAKKKNYSKKNAPQRSALLRANSILLPTPVMPPSLPMTIDEKGQLVALICLFLSLLIIALFYIHLAGIWNITKAGLVIMWILLLIVTSTAIVKNEQEVNRWNMRPLFRGINSFMHWFFKVSFVLIIVAACLFALLLIIAAIIYYIGVAEFIISTLGLTIGIIVVALLVICGVFYLLELYPELFWVTFTFLLLGVFFFSLFMVTPASTALAVLGYVFLISGGILAILHIILSISDLG